MFYAGERRKRTQKVFTKPSRTVQSEAEACNINNIMRKYEKTGIVTHVRKTNGFYGDVSEVQDYHSAANFIAVAQESFMSLPASVRERFDNDPGKFIAFVDDPKNAEELVTMGLREAPKPAPEPVEVKVVNPVPDPQN